MVAGITIWLDWPQVLYLVNFFGDFLGIQSGELWGIGRIVMSCQIGKSCSSVYFWPYIVATYEKAAF